MSDAPNGISLGRHYDDATDSAGNKIVYEGERHVLLFGPNGTGKGTRFLIPNLLSIKDRSIVVIDPKGELAAVTADYRRTVGDVVMLNPFRWRKRLRSCKRVWRSWSGCQTVLRGGGSNSICKRLSGCR